VAFISQPSINVAGTKFTAVVSGTPSSYQWNLNGTPISGATSSTYTSAKSGSFTVTVGYTNGCSLTSSSVLPISLKSFTGSYISGITSLSWSTATEAALAHFNIQRSVDGNNYSTIDKVIAYNIQNSTYSYLDKSVGQLAGKVYYRLQAIDKLGSYTYSSVVSISTLDSRLSTISAYPNPAKSVVTISGSHIASVQVIDNLGRVIKTQTLQDATNPTLSVASLPVGLYHLRVQTTDGKINSVGFVKQ
jgi:hypothetical protein